MKHVFFVIALILCIPVLASAQHKDSLIVKDTTGKVVASSKVKKSNWIYKYDSTGKRVYEPRKAAILSAVLPGAGQAYNKKYWKIPLAWAAVGIPVYSYFYNRNIYHEIQYAITVSTLDKTDPGYQAAFDEVDPNLKYLVSIQSTNSLTNYRNEYRKNMDYSILFTLLLWGLNVVDATVDAHLKGFNVNDNLALKIKPAITSPNSIGISLVFKFADK